MRVPLFKTLLWRLNSSWIPTDRSDFLFNILQYSVGRTISETYWSLIGLRFMLRSLDFLLKSSWWDFVFDSSLRLETYSLLISYTSKSSARVSYFLEISPQMANAIHSLGSFWPYFQRVAFSKLIAKFYAPYTTMLKFLSTSRCWLLCI